MLAELDLDVGRERLYLSRRLTDPGTESWPRLLREAFDGDDTRSLSPCGLG